MQIIPAPRVVDPNNLRGMSEIALSAMLRNMLEQKRYGQQQEELASLKPLLQTALGTYRQSGQPGDAVTAMLDAATEMKDPFAVTNAIRLTPMFQQEEPEDKVKIEAWDPKGNKRIFYRTPTQVESLQEQLGPKGWKFSKPEQQEKVTMFRERKDGTWIQRDVTPDTAKRLEKQGWQYGERKGSPGEDLGTFEAKERIKAKYRDGETAPTPQQALRRISDIRKAMATLERTDEVTALLAIANPELSHMVGQKIDEELKQDLMDAWQNELDYLNDFVPAGSRTRVQPNYEFIPGKGLVKVE
jgi:hypothetical protein